MGPRAEHHTVYGIWPYVYGANTVTGTPVTVTVQQPEILYMVWYGINMAILWPDTGSYGCNSLCVSSKNEGEEK